MAMAPQSGQKFPEVVPPRSAATSGGTQRTGSGERVDPTTPSAIAANNGKPIRTGR